MSEIYGVLRENRANEDQLGKLYDGHVSSRGVLILVVGGAVVTGKLTFAYEKDIIAGLRLRQQW